MSSATRIELQPMTSPADGADLIEMLSGATGRVVQAGRVFGDEVELVIAPPGTEQLFHEGRAGTVGRWRVGTQGSRWRLCDAAGLVVNDGCDPTTLDTALSELVNVRVDHVTPRLPDLGLELGFADGRRLCVEGSADTTLEVLDYPAPPFWEVFTPDRHVISAGPGSYWARVPANVPEREISGPLLATTPHLALQYERERFGLQMKTSVVAFRLALARAWIVVALSLLALGSLAASVLGHGFWGRANVVVLSVSLIVVMLPDLLGVADERLVHRWRRRPSVDDAREQPARVRRS